jgi:hypothetical protein
MKMSQTRNLRNALIILFCISTPLAKTANSAVGTSNLNLQIIQNVTVFPSQSAEKQGLSSLDVKRAMAGNGPGTALPSLALLAPRSEWSAIFPIIGLIAAVVVTQLLRRRRIAQLRSSSSTGQ